MKRIGSLFLFAQLAVVSFGQPASAQPKKPGVPMVVPPVAPPAAAAAAAATTPDYIVKVMTASQKGPLAKQVSELMASRVPKDLAARAGVDGKAFQADADALLRETDAAAQRKAFAAFEGKWGERVRGAQKIAGLTSRFQPGANVSIRDCVRPATAKGVGLKPLPGDTVSIRDCVHEADVGVDLLKRMGTQGGTLGNTGAILLRGAPQEEIPPSTPDIVGGTLSAPFTKVFRAGTVAWPFEESGRIGEKRYGALPFADNVDEGIGYTDSAVDIPAGYRRITFTAALNLVGHAHLALIGGGGSVGVKASLHSGVVDGNTTCTTERTFGGVAPGAAIFFEDFNTNIQLNCTVVRESVNPIRVQPSVMVEMWSHFVGLGSGSVGVYRGQLQSLSVYATPN